MRVREKEEKMREDLEKHWMYYAIQNGYCNLRDWGRETLEGLRYD
jgi:hypothetical protein